MINILSESTTIIMKLQDDPTFAQTPECQDKWTDLYQRLFVWLSNNSDHKDYDIVICQTFALLNEVHEKGAIMDKRPLVQRTIRVIQIATGNKINPMLGQFLESQKRLSLQ